MSKQANPAPDDRPTPPKSAPPPPPRGRNIVWLIALIAAFFLWLVLPTVHSSTPALTYSQFLSDVYAHKVKTIEIAPRGRHQHRHADQQDQLHRGRPAAGQRDAADRAAGQRRDHLGVRVGDELRLRGAQLAADPRPAAADLRLAVLAAVQERGRRAAGRARRGPVAGQGVRRGAALDHVRRRGRLRGRQGRDRRGGGLPAQPGPVHPGRRAGAARGADGRAAGDRQDAAGPRGRGRGRGGVLLGHRLQLRGAVRRGRRGPGP